MKCKTILLLAILYCTAALGQGTGQYNLYMTASVQGQHHNNSCPQNYFRVTIKARPNNIFVTWQQDIKTPEDQPKYFTRATSTVDPFDSVIIVGERYWEPWFASCRTIDNPVTIRRNGLSLNGPYDAATKTISYKVPMWDAGGTPGITLYIWPKEIKIAASRPAYDNESGSSPNYSLPTEDKIRLTATSGFAPSAYQWQYSFTPFEESSWASLPYSFQSKDFIDICANDIFGANALAMVEQHNNISFRIQPIRISTPLGERTTETPVITLDMVPSAPHIVSAEAIDAKCHDEAEGVVKLTFDRALLTGETLIPLVDNLQYTDYTAFDNDTKSITISKLAPQAAQYTFSLLGFYNVTRHTTFTDGTGHTIKASISSPPAISFSHSSQNITCYNGYDGWITVNVTGGVGNYKLHWKTLAGKDSISAITGSSITLSNLKAGTYPFYVTDANDCYEKTISGEIRKEELTLTQPATGPQLSIQSSTEPSAYGASNGSLYVTVDGDNGSGYLQNYYDALTTYTPSKNDLGGGRYQFAFEESLPAGYYVFYYETTAGCKQSLPFSLSEPAPLTAGIYATAQIRCIGDNNGSLSVSASGGVLPAGSDYSYQWAKLSGGVYEDIPFAIGTQLDNLTAGSYRVTVTDQTWASPKNEYVAYASLSDPSPIQITGYNLTHVACYGNSTGAAVVNVQGGSGYYTLKYKKEGEETERTLGFGASSNATVSGLAAGEYTVTALSDGNNCAADLSSQNVTFTINEPAAPLLLTRRLLKSTSGFGRSDGAIHYEVTGGTPNGADPLYTTVWKNGQGALVAKTEAVVDGVFITQIRDLPKEKYILEVRDRNNCFVTVSDSIKEPDPLSITLRNPYLIKCFGDSSGLIVADVNGGVPFSDTDSAAYRFSWYGIAHDNTDSLIMVARSDTLPSLPIGRYKVYVEDSSTPPNTIVSNVLTIAQPPELTTVLTTRNIPCYGTNDGYIHIEVAGGVGGYRMFYRAISEEYTDFVEHPLNASDNTFYLDSLKADTYSVYIIDANDCYAAIEGEAVIDIVLTQPQKPLGLSAFRQRSVSGAGMRNGTISIDIEGGTTFADRTYRIVWRNEWGLRLIPKDTILLPATYRSVIDSLPIGIYTVTITDSLHTTATTGKDSTCFFSMTFNITEPQKLETDIEETHFISCNGLSDGSLALHISGGVVSPDPSMPRYKITWYKYRESYLNTGFVQTSDRDSMLYNMPTGIYRAIVEDYSWLPNRDTVTYELVQPEPLTATATDLLVSCGDLTDVYAWVKGGTRPYNYEWSTGDTDSVIYQAVPGKYMVFITDARGCQTTAMAKVTAPTDLKIEGTTHDPLCYKGNNGRIELKITGGRSPYSYKWSTGATTQTLSGVTAGSYSVIVTDSEKCASYMDFTLSDPEPISVSLGEDRTLCRGQKHELKPVVDDPKTRFAWTGPGGFTSSEPRIMADREGIYSLTITDSNGCQATDEINITVMDVDITAEIVVASQVFTGDTVVMVNISNPMPEAAQWYIGESDSLQITAQSEHQASIIFRYPGFYAVGLRTFVGECFADVVKLVSVMDSDLRDYGFAGESLIRKFLVRPTPNEGKFIVDIELGRISAVRVRLINIGTGIVMADSRHYGQYQYSLPYDMLLAGGGYIVTLETESGSMVAKMIVK